jgi:alcohol dehydrogenase
MIPFGIQVTGYQSLMMGLKGLIKTVPFPKPTLFSGPGSSLELCEAISLMGVHKLLIVTDAMLVKIGVRFEVYDGIQPDPTIDQIEAGLKILRRERCQAILAVGGGSSIDAAKIIAARATNDKPVRRMEGFFRVFSAPTPLYAIPTTAGTGSEVTIAAVVSDPGRKKKSSVIDPKLVPLMAALDGALMTGLPPHITAATGMDALTHAVEAYLSTNALPETDAYALAATKLIAENLPTAVSKGKDVKARQAMSFASYYPASATSTRSPTTSAPTTTRPTDWRTRSSCPTCWSIRVRSAPSDWPGWAKSPACARKAIARTPSPGALSIISAP